MANRNRQKMPIAQRAKQFAPFAALKGLPEALAQKEQTRETRRSISEDEVEKINTALLELQIGQTVTVEYYQGSAYTRLTGKVTRRNLQSRTVTVDEITVYFSDISAISILAG